MKNGWGITGLDWLIAWRHLRVGDGRPAWVAPLLTAALYVMVVGLGFALYSAHLGDSAAQSGGVEISIHDAFKPPGDPPPTPLQRYFGVFGALTLLLGAMPLIFGLFSWFFNLLATIITMSVLLGCMALVVVLSLMSGLEEDLRDKILNQKAHIRISRADGKPFEDYDTLADVVVEAPEVAGTSPYVEGEIMVRSGLNRQGALLLGIAPARQRSVSNLSELVREGEYDYLSNPQDIPDPDPFSSGRKRSTPWRLRHLEKERASRDAAAVDKLPKEAESPHAPAVPPPWADEDGETGSEDGTDEAAWGVDTTGGASDGTEGSTDDGGWEDPRELVPLLRQSGALPPRSQREPARDRSGGSETGMADDLGDGEGWEDPREIVPKLRAEGKLPELEESTNPGDGPDSDGFQEPADPADADAASEDEQLDPILLGRELAMELGVRVGSRVQLTEPGLRMTPAGLMPGIMAVKVGGVFYSGMYEYDRKNVYAPLDVVQRFLRVGPRVTGIEVKLEDVDAIDEGKAAVEGAVAVAGRADELLVEDWRDLNRNLFSAMFLEKVAMFIALLFVVLVASFGILASNLMSVLEKSKEIAILKAMGNSDDAVLRVFVAEGLCLGALGSLSGIGLGLVLTWALDTFGFPLNESVYYIERLPAVVNPVEVVLVGVAALVIVWLSSLYPALLASRVRPVDALRHIDA